jgi:hypothetical protein
MHGDAPVDPARVRGGPARLPDDVRATLPVVLHEHRDRMYARHLGAPVEL